jgi:hypothetical protein
LTDALPEIPPTVATTLPPRGVEPALKAVELPELGESVPSVAGATDHLADAAEMAFPKASAAVATNAREPRAATEAESGETATAATWPGFTVAVCVPPRVPAALAVSTGLPAVVSS